jgi:hypothetical protein
VVSESADRYDTVGQAQSALLDFFKKEPIPSSRLEKSKAVNYLRYMPRGFLMQCMTEINIPSRIESLEHQGKQWNLKVRAQNGNTAKTPWTSDTTWNRCISQSTLKPLYRAAAVHSHLTGYSGTRKLTHYRSAEILTGVLDWTHCEFVGAGAQSSTARFNRPPSQYW